mgnify:CR=1 FL=1
MATKDSNQGSYPGSGHYPGMGEYPGSGQYPGMAMEEGLSVQEILDTLWRRKIAVVLIAGVMALGALGFALTQAPSYQADARILLEENAPSSGVLGELSALTGAPPAAAEMEVVKSREILKRIVALPEEDSLGLGLMLRVDDLDRYQPLSAFLARWAEDAPKGNLSARLAGTSAVKKGGSALLQIGEDSQAVLSWTNAEKKKQETVIPWGRHNTLSLEGLTLILTADGDLSGRRFSLTWMNTRSAIDRLLGAIRVSETARGSGVLKISLSDSDPFRAAEVVNQVVRSYMERSRDRVALRAKTTVSYIEEQIERIQGELEEAESALVEYQEREGAALLTEAARTVVERISSLDLEQAKLAMLIGSQDQLVQAIEAGQSVEELGAGIELDPQTASLLQEIRVLRGQESLLAGEYQDEWPPLMQVRAQITQVRQTITGAAQARASALHKKNDTLQRAVDRWQTQLNELPATERELAKFQRKAESFEGIYTFLLAQEQEARITEKASIATVSVVDWAVPALSRSSPNLAKMTGMGLLLGLLFGAALALWRESTQKKVLSAAQLEAVTGLPQWGIIPDFLRGGARTKGASSQEYFLALRDAPDSFVAESYRSLRANLRFAAKVQDIKTLTITSASQGEGKSTTIADLAIALANGGSKVLLVDADLRRPVIHRMFSCAQSPGLAEVLQGQGDWSGAVVAETGTVNLSVFPAGKANGKNPGDLLALPEVVQLVDALKAAFDYVLFDVPPVLAVADAASFLNHLDALLFLTRYDYSSEIAVAGATQRLKISGAEPLGCVLNGVKLSSRRFQETNSYDN